MEGCTQVFSANAFLAGHFVLKPSKKSWFCVQQQLLLLNRTISAAGAARKVHQVDFPECVYIIHDREDKGSRPRARQVS